MIVKWITKINIPKTLLLGLIFSVISTLVHQIEALLTMNYYKDPAFSGVWNKLMMSSTGPPPIEYFITSLIISFVTGVSLVLVYYYLRDRLASNFRERFLHFADLLVGLNFVFFILPCYLLFNLPGGLLISWFISSFIILVSISYAIVKLIK